jgi:hypothetical protein
MFISKSARRGTETPRTARAKARRRRDASRSEGPGKSASRYARPAKRLPGGAGKGERSRRAQNARNHARHLAAGLRAIAMNGPINGHLRSVDVVYESMPTIA